MHLLFRFRYDCFSLIVISFANPDLLSWLYTIPQSFSMIVQYHLKPGWWIAAVSERVVNYSNAVWNTQALLIQHGYSCRGRVVAGHENPDAGSARPRRKLWRISRPSGSLKPMWRSGKTPGRRCWRREKRERRETSPYLNKLKDTGSYLWVII